MNFSIKTILFIYLFIQQPAIADFYVINSQQKFDDISEQIKKQLEIPFKMPTIELKNKDGKEQMRFVV